MAVLKTGMERYVLDKWDEKIRWLHLLWRRGNLGQVPWKQ